MGDPQHGAALFEADPDGAYRRGMRRVLRRGTDGRFLSRDDVLAVVAAAVTGTPAAVLCRNEPVHAAAGAFFLAGRGGGRLLRLVTLPEEKFLRDAAVDHVPGEDLPVGDGAARIEGRVEAAVAEDLHPPVEVEVLVPGVKAHTAAHRALDCVGDPAVAPGEHRLDMGDPGVVVVIADLAVLDVLQEEFLLFLQQRERVLPLPLEGGVGLRDEARHAEGDLGLHPAVSSLAAVVLAQHVLSHVGDSRHVLEGLVGQAVHEI